MLLRLLPFAPLCLALLLSACGGGGAPAGAGDAPKDAFDPVVAPPLYATGPLRAQIQFPPDRSLGKCGQITVRGTAGGEGIAGVRVNGVAAQGFGEFGEWAAKIPLVCGANVIRVDVEADGGGGLASADGVRLDVLEEFFYTPGAIARGGESNLIYCLDPLAGDVLAVNRSTGVRRRMGFPLNGTTGQLMVDDGGRQLYQLRGFTLTELDVNTGFVRTTTLETSPGALGFQSAVSDVDNDRFFASDGLRVYEYDTTNGSRILVSSAGAADALGTGPSPQASAGMAYDAQNARLFCGARTEIVEVDLATGNRRLVTDAPAPVGHPLEAIGWNRSIGRILAYATRTLPDHTPTGILYSVDPVFGGRLLLSGATRGSGEALPALFSETYFTAERGLHVSDQKRGHVLTIDPATGNRTVSADHRLGSGPPVIGPVDAILDASTGRLVLANSLKDSLLSVDVATGNRTLLSGADRGTGPDFASLQAIVEAFSEGAIFALDAGRDAVVRVDLATGNRTVVSDATRGAGTPFAVPIDLAWGPAQGVLYVADRSLGHPALRGAVVAVDVATGNRTTVSDGLITIGFPWLNMTGIAYDAARARFVTSDRDQQSLIAVDALSGLRSGVTDANTGIGLPLLEPGGVNVDVARNRALVSGWTIRGMFSVDLDSGDRLVVYDDHHGRGPLTARPRAAIPHTLPGQLIVLDGPTGTILVVDEVSGDRVLISK